MTNEIDKSKELNINLSLVNEKLHFIGNAGAGETISIDYTPPYGDNLGFTSLEIFLFSLASCYASSQLAVLRQMKKSIKGLDVSAKGFRRSEHPTCFESIILNFTLKSPDISRDEFERACKISEGTLCPVYAMIKGNVNVTTEFTIICE